MQAGTGGLYGTPAHINEYRKRGYDIGSHVNVYKLIQDYRKKVNHKVCVYCCQTAGYDNMVVPQMSYRTALLSGWTGKEALFMDMYRAQWDKVDEASKN